MIESRRAHGHAMARASLAAVAALPWRWRQKRWSGMTQPRGLGMDGPCPQNERTTDGSREFLKHTGLEQAEGSHNS